MANLFNEKLFIIPGAAVATDFVSTPRVSSQSSGIVLLAAESTNGIPYSKGRVYEFTQAADATQVLKSGPAVDLINCLFSPSPDFKGPEKVLFVRTNDAKQASLDLIAANNLTQAAKYTVTVAQPVAGSTYFIHSEVSVAGKKPEVLEFTTKILGETTNITFAYETSDTPSASDILNLFKDKFNEIEGVTAYIEDDTLKITALETLLITDSTTNTCLSFTRGDDNKSYTLAVAAQASTEYNFAVAVKYGEAKISDITTKIVEFCNSLTGITAEATQSGFTASSLYQNMDFTMNFTGSTATITPVKTSAVTATPVGYIKSVDYGRNQNLAYKFSQGLASFYLDGNILMVIENVSSISELKAALDANVTLNKYFSISIETGNENELLPDTNAVVPFTVYEDTPTTLASFNEALQITSSFNKSTVISQFESPAYHLALQSYCLNVSEFECVPVLGGALGETPSQVLERSKALNGEAILCYPGIYLALTDTSALYSPVYFAAKVAGLRAGLPPQTPLTRKTISCLGFEEINTENTSMTVVREKLINGGVLFGTDIIDKGYCIDKGINTVQGQVNRQILGTDNRTHEDSIVRIKQQMQKDIRISAANTFPGTTRLKPSKADVMDFYRKYFNSKVGTYLTGWDDSTLTVRCEEDAWYGECLMYINGPINSAFFTLHFALDENI